MSLIEFYRSFTLPLTMPCEVCGRWEERCLCPKCPVCGERGRRTCYDTEEGHGLVRCPEQVESMKIELDKWNAITQAEAEYWMARDREEIEEVWK